LEAKAAKDEAERAAKRKAAPAVKAAKKRRELVEWNAATWGTGCWKDKK
jgi:hypothetical protein